MCLKRCEKSDFEAKPQSRQEAKEKFEQILCKIAFVTDSIAQDAEILQFEDAKRGFDYIMYDIERELKELLKEF
ncbi:hypothetical protein RZR97_08300 [Hydrogenimonas thermophila]|uniref:hypothetical protein n=1 Tax=Hydrogenimonas thermophila TaxID=223786 RepID=UPI002937203C|nr:hypothetical protein [Hydrogenimonas thermophila]WOE69108.1 hypothetical protein RZR91_08325 [Hydrogenimonas thermophila]WOE71618.1 hypothetical protein RZR97_08300 [Hydrogenimonas thermophila]